MLVFTMFFIGLTFIPIMIGYNYNYEKNKGVHYVKC